MSADTTFTEFDRRAMARALELAERGAETTHPNPRVGCVIAHGDRIIAEGWHERAGGPHAEVAALRALAGPAAGTTVYVTLEPCSHHGRTPPCAEALIAARVARVIYAIDDPNPQVAGRGAAALRTAGIEVASGLMASEAHEANIGFFMRMSKGRPFVRVKMGASLDGRVALSNGASRWITGEAARNDVQRWRARSSAVLTGIGTVLADDPQLNVRLPGGQRQPLRVVLDSELRTPATARILDASAPTLIFTQTGTAAAEAALVAKGARIERPANAGISSEPTVNLHSMLSRLAKLEINEVLVEAGPTLSGAFVQHGLADELLLYMAPKLLGPQARPLFDLPLLEDLQQAARLRIIEQTLIGEDLRLRLRPT
jgi:diaminohydroxyphosphoribosylaminopyrimidine deaminase / 5-amino-6-(5-phosphoribosylamino)uracil reductase